MKIRMRNLIESKMMSAQLKNVYDKFKQDKISLANSTIKRKY